jgi:hypothetical protein
VPTNSMQAGSYLSGERYWYRTMFDEHFPPHCAETVARWTPTWSKQTDPSGRYIFLFGTFRKITGAN